MIDLLGQAAHGLLLAVLLLHCVLAGSFTWILVQYLRYRRAGLQEEARLLAEPLPPDSELPDVLVQIPTYNEGDLVMRVAAAVASLDWPRDKLHVQVLDDSTDRSSIAFAEQAVNRMTRDGNDAKLLRRPHRHGFKAGAVGEGLHVSNAPFVAIFDADYVPSAQFLRSCIRPMLVDPRVALVQARCDFLNGEENTLTRVQRRLQDAHFAVEQPVRAWTGQVLPFNGTCGVWRRAAIDDAGGWQGDTLAEDLDLSYRVQLCGWRGRYLLSVSVPGELPSTFHAWRAQQFRWTKGPTEVGRKLWLSLWRSQLPFGKKLVSQAHLSDNFYMPIHAAEIVLCALDFSIGAGVTWSVVAGLVLAHLQELGGLGAMIVIAQRNLRAKSIWQEVLQLPLVAFFEFYNLSLQVRAVVDALLGRSSPFVRTPKRAISSSNPG